MLFHKTNRIKLFLRARSSCRANVGGLCCSHAPLWDYVYLGHKFKHYFTRVLTRSPALGSIVNYRQDYLPFY